MHPRFYYYEARFSKHWKGNRHWTRVQTSSSRAFVSHLGLKHPLHELLYPYRGSDILFMGFRIPREAQPSPSQTFVSSAEAQTSSSQTFVSPMGAQTSLSRTFVSLQGLRNPLHGLLYPQQGLGNFCWTRTMRTLNRNTRKISTFVYNQRQIHRILNVVWRDCDTHWIGR